MAFLIFDTCCGCIELKTGCLIIGYLQLVGEILYMALGMIALVTGGVEAAHGKDEEAQSFGAAVLVLGIIIVVAVLFSFTFTVVLLIGLHKDKRGHVKAYLIVAAICLVLALITTLAAPFSGAGALDVIKSFVTYILNVYFVLVIRSYYIKMDEMKPAVYNTA